MSGRLTLDSRLDLPAAEPLLTALLAERDGALQIDAGAVEHLGGLCLQLLLAAAEDWRDRGLGFRIEPRSRPFSDAVTTFGLTTGALCSDAADTCGGKPPHDEETRAPWL